MKDHKEFETHVDVVMSVIDELTQSYELIDKPDINSLNTLPLSGYGQTNKDGSKKRQSIKWSISITKPTRSEIEKFVRSRLISYKFS